MTLEKAQAVAAAKLDHDYVADDTGIFIRAEYLRALLAITDAFREIRARIAHSDVPIHVAADIEQIICETGGDSGDEAARNAS